MRPTKIVNIKKFPHGKAFQFNVSLADIPKTYVDETKELLPNAEINTNKFFVKVVLDKNGWEILDNTICYKDSEDYHLMVGEEKIEDDSELAKEVFQFCINNMLEVATA